MEIRSPLVLTKGDSHEDVEQRSTGGPGQPPDVRRPDGPRRARLDRDACNARLRESPGIAAAALAVSAWDFGDRGREFRLGLDMKDRWWEVWLTE